MITDSITVNDGVADRTFALISRAGMDSVRVETTAGVSSSSQSRVLVRHTIDAKSKTKPNRHLVSFSFTEYDAAGNPVTATAHVVITRQKANTDPVVLKLVEMLANFVGDPATAGALLIGSN